MKAFLESWCTLAAALVVAAAGIFDVIDQPSMITLVIVLVCLPRARGACRLGWRGQ